jgi:hypothetical protein
VVLSLATDASDTIHTSAQCPPGGTATSMQTWWMPIPVQNRDFSRAPRKVKIFVPGPFRILELAPFSDLAGWISQHHATFTAPLH